jgi:hypothetical protein
LTHRSRNARSIWFVASRWCAIARRIVVSEPGQLGSHTSLFEAVFDRRGSSVTIFAPFSWPSMIRCACGLK